MDDAGPQPGHGWPVCGPLSKKPAKPTRLRHLRGSTFWILFGASKSISAVRPRTDLRSSIAPAIPNKKINPGITQ